MLDTQFIAEHASAVSSTSFLINNETVLMILSAEKLSGVYSMETLKEWLEAQSDRWGPPHAFELITVGSRLVNPRKWLVTQFPSFMREVEAYSAPGISFNSSFYLALAYLKGVSRDATRELYVNI